MGDVGGRWPVVSGRWPVASGQWSVSGRWLDVGGAWSAVGFGCQGPKRISGNPKDRECTGLTSHIPHPTTDH